MNTILLAANTVGSTNDYTAFKFLPGNRVPDPFHVNRLAQSYALTDKGNRFNPVLVNDRFEILDGQHTYLAMMKLGLPVHYLLNDSGASIKDVIAMNTTTKNWLPNDYARSYAQAGVADYQLYLDIQSEYALPHKVAVLFITGAGDKVGSKLPAFRMGRLKARPRDEIIVDVELLTDIGEVYPHAKAVSFAATVFKISRHSQFNRERLVGKLAELGYTIPRMSGREDNLRAIERVYNHNLRDASRVRFDIDIDSDSDNKTSPQTSPPSSSTTI